MFKDIKYEKRRQPDKTIINKYMKTIITTNKAPQPIGPYSQAVLVGKHYTLQDKLL